MGRAYSPVAISGRVAVVLTLVEVDRGKHAERVLARLAPLSPPDRALAWNLTKGVLRHRREIDYLIASLSNRPVERIDPIPRAALRMACYEIRKVGTPAHAAVSEAVSACCIAGAARAASLVNAVARRIPEAPEAPEREQTNHPEWLLKRWESRYEREAVAAWTARNALPSPTGIVARSLSDDLTSLFEKVGLKIIEARLFGLKIQAAWILPPGVGPSKDLPGLAEGRYWIQDPAAVAVADYVGAKQGMRVLDACAAPGGKTFRLLSRGADVLSVDHDERRLSLVFDGAKRLGFTVQCRLHDWLKGPLPSGEVFDAVLVDAPCSALGLVRRHPEIRWNRKPEDLASYATRQQAILTSAARCVRPGGVLVYAVCSGEPEEGLEVIARFLTDHPYFQFESVLCTIPPEGDEDGFWAARMVYQPA